MHKEGELDRKKALLYTIHGVKRSANTHNVHHVVFKADGGSNNWHNLALLPRETHEFVHDLIQKMDKQV